MIPIILASTSPRRQQLLSLAGIEFETLAVDIDETVHEEEAPQDYIMRMVANKADAARQALYHTMSPPPRRQALDALPMAAKLIITADTIGVLPDGRSILVKPIDRQDAFVMWAQMSNSTHWVWTAVQLSVINSHGDVVKTQTILEKTEVTFRRLSKQDMADYWSSGEPQDKAGGYAIQGKGAAWVERINGSYTNVVGLPLSQTLSAIHKIINLV